MSEAPRNIYRALLVPVYLPSLFIAVGQQATWILLPLYVLEVGGTAADAALVAGLRGVGMMLAALPAGVLAARFGDRAVMLTCIALVAVCAFGLAALQSLWALGVLALVFGAGAGGWMLARLSYITAFASVHERGRAISGVAGLQRFGLFVGPLAGGALATQAGYDVAFIVAGLATVTALLLVWWLTQRVEHVSLAADAGSPGFARALGMLKEYAPVFRTAGLAAITITVVRHGRQLLIPLWGAAIGLDAAAIGLIFSLASLLDMLMFYPAGQLIDRQGRRWAAGLCLAVMSLATALLPFADGFGVLLGVALLSGVGNGLGTGIVMTLGSDLAPAARRGEFLGVWRLVADLGGASGPFAIGALAAGFGLVAATLSTAAFGAFGVLVVVTVVRETLRRPDRQTAND